MAVYKEGERKNRPGVYMRFTDIGDPSKVRQTTYVPEPSPEPEPDTELMFLGVTPEGVMYSIGQALTLSAAEGSVAINQKIDATVYGTTMVIENQR